MKNRLGNRRLLPALGLVATGALALGACGGSGFEGDGESAEPSGELSHADRLVAVTPRPRPSRTRSPPGRRRAAVEAEVTVGADLNQQLSQGFAGDNPPDVFYVSTDQFAGLRQQRLALRVRRRPVERGRLLPDARRRVHRRRRVLLRAEGLLDARPGDQHRALGGRRASPTPTSPRRGTTCERSPTKLTKGEQVGLSFGPEYQRVGAFFPQAGGAMVNEDGTEATVDSPENLEALEYVQGR